MAFPKILDKHESTTLAQHSINIVALGLRFAGMLDVLRGELKVGLGVTERGGGGSIVDVKDQ